MNTENKILRFPEDFADAIWASTHPEETTTERKSQWSCDV